MASVNEGVGEGFADVGGVEGPEGVRYAAGELPHLPCPGVLPHPPVLVAVSWNKNTQIDNKFQKN